MSPAATATEIGVYPFADTTPDRARDEFFLACAKAMTRPGAAGRR